MHYVKNNAVFINQVDMSHLMHFKVICFPLSSLFQLHHIYYARLRIFELRANNLICLKKL